MNNRFKVEIVMIAMAKKKGFLKENWKAILVVLLILTTLISFEVYSLYSVDPSEDFEVNYSVDLVLSASIAKIHVDIDVKRNIGVLPKSAVITVDLDISYDGTTLQKTDFVLDIPLATGSYDYDEDIKLDGDVMDHLTDGDSIRVTTRMFLALNFFGLFTIPTQGVYTDTVTLP